MSLRGLPPARLFNAIYAWAVERIEDREKFDYDLNAPIPGRRVSQATVEQERDAFAALAAAFSA